MTKKETNEEGQNQYSKSNYWKHSFSKVKEKTKQRGNKKTWNKHRCTKIGQAVIRKPNQRRQRQKSNRFCPVHIYPDIFDYGDFYLHFQTNTQPHVTYSNRSHPSTRKRLIRWKYHSFIIEHALCWKYMMYVIIVFRIRNCFRPPTRKRKADVCKNLHSTELYWKGAFSVIIFHCLSEFGR